MSNTKREPLLSRQDINDKFMYGNLIKDAAQGFMNGALYVQEIYEENKAKSDELTQLLVDFVRHKDSCEWDWGQPCDCGLFKLLDAAEAAGFKPSGL